MGKKILDFPTVVAEHDAEDDRQAEHSPESVLDADRKELLQRHWEHIDSLKYLLDHCLMEVDQDPESHAYMVAMRAVVGSMERTLEGKEA